MTHVTHPYSLTHLTHTILPIFTKFGVMKHFECMYPVDCKYVDLKNPTLEMWANAQRDGRPAEYRWRHLFNAAKFG